MLGRVAVHLGGGGLEDAHLEALGEPEHVDRAVHARLRRLHRVELVMDRGGGARQVVDPVHLDVERPGDVVAHELELRVAQQVLDVLPPGGEEVVHAKNLVPPRQQPLAEVRLDCFSFVIFRQCRPFAQF